MKLLKFLGKKKQKNNKSENSSKNVEQLSPEEYALMLIEENRREREANPSKYRPYSEKPEDIVKEIDSWDATAIRADFAGAFDVVEYGDDLSEILEMSLSDKDISKLAILYRYQPQYREKICELIIDCEIWHDDIINDFKNGNYDKYL